MKILISDLNEDGSGEISIYEIYAELFKRIILKIKPESDPDEWRELAFEIKKKGIKLYSSNIDFSMTVET